MGSIARYIGGPSHLRDHPTVRIGSQTRHRPRQPPSFLGWHIDDTWSSTKAGVPHFDQFCSPLNIHFKDSKKVVGSLITILGVTLDLTQKTAKIDDRKASILALEAGRLLDVSKAGKVKPNELSIFLGRAEFCSKVTTLGRVNSSELVRCFAEFASEGGDVTSDLALLELNDLARRELEWWQQIRGHPPLLIGQNKKRCISTIASDASQNAFGLYIDGRVAGGSLPTEHLARPIHEKEAWALAKLIKGTVKSNTDYTFLCDNSIAVAAFSKGRSSNQFINDLVAISRRFLHGIGSRIRVVWVSTLTMTKLADPPSRGRFTKDEFGLSENGVDHLLRLQPDLGRRLDAGDCISLFGSPANNPLKIAYCSLDFNLDDVYCKRKDAFALLEARAAKSQQIEGGVFCFPPPLLTGLLIDYVVRLGLGSDTQIFLIIPASQVLGVRNKLGLAASICIQRFCAKRNRNLLFRAPGKDLSLVTISSWDVRDRNNAENPGGKRRRLR